MGQDIRKICNETQARVQALGQAIGRQPGMPGSLTELLNNDMRVIAQQFASTAYHARMIEKKLQERGRVQLQERESELKHLKTKLQNSQDRVRKLEESLHSTEEGYATADKRRKVELEKKAEKIQNQKRRIKEQQDQIDVSLVRPCCFHSNETNFFSHPEPQEEDGRRQRQQEFQSHQQSL